MTQNVFEKRPNEPATSSDFKAPSPESPRDTFNAK